RSGMSDDYEGNITYKFDLETPLAFPFTIYPDKEPPQTKNKFFRDTSGFSMTGYNDKLTLDDTEDKIYLEIYHFPHSTLIIKPQEITWKNNLIRVKIEPNKIREGLEIRQIELEGK
ncbi:9477_t:CDS:2, partial [Ambispora leptoticha]